MGNSITAPLSDVDESGTAKLHRFRYHLGSGFVTRDDVVLDLGCGQTYGTYILSQKAKEVHGFDIDEGSINYWTERYKDIKNITLHAGNLEEIEIPKADVVCMFEVLEHLYKPSVFIQKLKSQVRKYICISVPLGQHVAWNDEAKDVVEDGDWSHHSSFESPEVVISLFTDDTWGEFFSFRIGVTFIAIFYNRNLLKESL